MKTTPHKQERALATRRDLIDAARAIFAEEGFESARIEEIATRAGKTRGAFYANFNDKEDVFFAIFEEDMMRDQDRMVIALSGATNLDEKIEVIAHHLVELLSDRQRLLLSLEFKMYVIRHQHKRRRLNQLYTEMCMRCAMKKVSCLLPECNAEERHRLTMEVGAVIDGVALNAMFSPESLSEGQRMRLLKNATRDALMGARDEQGSR